VVVISAVQEVHSTREVSRGLAEDLITPFKIAHRERGGGVRAEVVTTEAETTTTSDTIEIYPATKVTVVGNGILQVKISAQSSGMAVASEMVGAARASTGTDHSHYMSSNGSQCCNHPL